MNVYKATPEVSDVTLLMKPLMYCRLNLSLSLSARGKVIPNFTGEKTSYAVRCEFYFTTVLHEYL